MALTKIPGELFSVGDLDISDVGTISLDAIEGDADSNTSITFSGSDVITIATGGSNRLTIGDGALSPVTDNQIDLGTASLKYKNFYAALVDGENFKVNGGQGSDGQVLTSTGSGVAWEDAAGGASSINDLSDAKTFGTSSIMLGDATTGTISGANYNTAVGIDVFAALTTGDKNTALGFGALTAVSTGNNMVAIGYNALSTASTVEDNVAVGTEALASTNNSRNMGIGYRALTAQSGSSDNMAIGYDALVRQTTGANGNIAIGPYAGRAVVDSASTSQLIAIGQNVASSNTGALAGYQNVFIGYNIASSSSLAGAFQNTAVGGSTLTALTTGDDNTCLGKGAGSTITTGSRNILIGVGAATSAVGVNDEIVIGKDVGGGGASSFVFGSGSYDTKCEFNSTTWTNPSDIRLKEDIQDEVIGLDFINDLRPVTFRWKKEKDIPQTLRAYKEGSEKRAANGKYNHGFIAQEVKEVIDRYDLKDGFDMWSEDELDGRQRVGEAALMPLMVKAVQELSAKVEELEDKLKEK